MLRSFACLVATLSFAMSLAVADDEPVRLPGQGEVKPDVAPQLTGTDRLIPGGGLLVSFDTNTDGRVSEAELIMGIEAAFVTADRDENGRLTPLEQIAWAEGLPTRDASLMNPVRFDPNLDRMVSAEEFSLVIMSFATNLTEAETGDILVTSLKSTRRGRRDGPDAIEEARTEPGQQNRQRQERQRDDRNRRF